MRCTRQWREEDLWESSERQVRGFNYMFPSAGNEQRAVVCNIGNEGSNGNELHLQVGDNKESRDSRESCDQEITLPILCDMAHSGKGRRYLWPNKGLDFYISLLSEQYWQVTALDAIHVW